MDLLRVVYFPAYLSGFVFFKFLPRVIFFLWMFWQFLFFTILCVASDSDWSNYNSCQVLKIRVSSSIDLGKPRFYYTQKLQLVLLGKCQMNLSSSKQISRIFPTLTEGMFVTDRTCCSRTSLPTPLSRSWISALRNWNARVTRCIRHALRCTTLRQRCSTTPATATTRTVTCGVSGLYWWVLH